jgi:hypothetical protein
VERFEKTTANYETICIAAVFYLSATERDSEQPDRFDYGK